MHKMILLSLPTLLVVSFFAWDSTGTGPQTSAVQESLPAYPAMGDSMAADSLGSDAHRADSAMADSLAQGAKTGEFSPPEADTAWGGIFRSLENQAFGLGEKLVFDISYGPINAGVAVMEVKEIVPMAGRDCYHVISTAESNKFFSRFFKVEDRAESFVDVKGLFPWKFEKHLREGKYRADRWAIYDQVNHTVSTDRGDMEVPPYVQDVLSALYFVRTLEMAVGQPLFIQNHSGKKVYSLEVKIHRRERVKVPAGTFECFVAEPILKAGGVFKHEGRIWVWLTADERKMPVLMKSKVIIGSIDAKLRSYRLGQIS